MAPLLDAGSDKRYSRFFTSPIPTNPLDRAAVSSGSSSAFCGPGDNRDSPDYMQTEEEEQLAMDMPIHSSLAGYKRARPSVM